MSAKLVVAVTGASGMIAAKRLMEKSPFETALVVSAWGKEVYRRECGPLSAMDAAAAVVYDNEDLAAPIASGSVDTIGMAVIPCSSNTLGEIATGIGRNLIARAAHCHLKERRPLVIALRETPLTLIDLDNARTVAAAGGVIMPISPPFFMTEGEDPEAVSMIRLIDAYVDRVLKLFGVPPERTWEHIR